MCGIVGLVNGHPVASDLVAALGRLEYRGYDSAGIAVAGDALVTHKVLGRARDLAPAVEAGAPAGHAGIGHTRWATHGRPELRNAHPHCFGGVAVVHNGIIENHAELRAELVACGHCFASDTDSEVVPHLIADAIDAGYEPLEALESVCGLLRGSYALAVLVEGVPDAIYVARRGSPLLVATGENIAAVASDAVAFAGLPVRCSELADGEIAELTHHGLRFATPPVTGRSWAAAPAAAGSTATGGFAHDTRREIAAQREALRATADGLAGLTLPPAIAGASRLTVVACGSSLPAAGTARHAIEQATGLPMDLEIASEFRDRPAPPAAGSVALLVSQSGETADTLATMPALAARGVPCIGVVNVPGSAIGRQSDLLWPTAAGPELGVAATKSFTAQLHALLALGLRLGQQRGTIAPEFDAALAAALEAAPEVVDAAQAAEPHCVEIARRLVREGEALFLGRGPGAALAAEGALKLKELSYLHAEGFAAGELKHGPIALVREGTPVIAIAPGGPALPKLLANMSAVRARGAYVVALTDEAGEAACREAADEVLVLPGATPEVAPFAAAVALQLIAYHAALLLGHDVDRPRNLAKSVTVE